MDKIGRLEEEIKFEKGNNNGLRSWYQGAVEELKTIMNRQHDEIDELKKENKKLKEECLELNELHNKYEKLEEVYNNLKSENCKLKDENFMLQNANKSKHNYIKKLMEDLEKKNDDDYWRGLVEELENELAEYKCLKMQIKELVCDDEDE